MAMIAREGWLAYLWIIVALVVCIIAVWAGRENPSRFFDEGSAGTWFNALQLLACAFCAFALHHLRRKMMGRKDARIWLIVALGSLYLAADESFTFHEHKGRYLSFVRQVLHVPLGNAASIGTFRLPDYSDLILCSYGVLAVVIAIAYRRELFSDRNFTYACMFATLMLSCSMIIDCNLLRFVDPALNLHGPMLHRLEAWEESLKVIGFSGMLAGLLDRVLRLWHQCLPEKSALTG